MQVADAKINFADNSTRVPKGQPGYNALFKVSYPLEIMMKGMRHAWDAGGHLTIDKRMIKYMGPAVSCVQ